MSHHIDPTGISVADLPGILRDMAALIGLQATLTLVQHYGGVRLYVPITMTPDHILARQIGFDEASKLSAEYGGLAHFEIPFGKKAIRAVRDTEIAERYIKGTPIRQLARAYILTERGITKILAKRQIGQEDRQAALF